MPASGTYTSSLDLADFIDEAFERCGIDPGSVEARHLRSARRSIELLFTFWQTRGIHLWLIEEVTLPMVAGTATYNTDANTLAVLDMFLRRDGVDIEVNPWARDEFVDMPDKTIQGMPSEFYLDRQRDIPTLSFWPVPENSTDEIHYYRVRRFQEGGSLGNTPDVPYYWYEAFVAGLAAKLAEKYAPEREDRLVSKANAAYELADTEDRQRTPTMTKVRYRRR